MVLLSIVLIVLSYLIHISDLRLKHLISTFTFLLLFLCLALASFVLGHHSSSVVLLFLLVCWLLSVHIQNIMIYLNRSINSNYLSLKSNFHYVHVNVYCIFDIILNERDLSRFGTLKPEISLERDYFFARSRLTSGERAKERVFFVFAYTLVRFCFCSSK
jgi:hypothetical protein